METRICELKDCNKKHAARGYCHNHYEHWRRNGNPTKRPSRKKFFRCLICKEGIFRTPCRYLKFKHHFCSSRCWGIYFKKHNPNYKGGVAEYPNHYLMKKNRLIILLQNPRCEICGKPATEVHHKDFSKSNHELSNLQATCRSCNSKLRGQPNNTKFYKKYKTSPYQLADRLGLSYPIIYTREKEGTLESLLMSNSNLEIMKA